MHEILAFLNENSFGIFVLLALFGGGIGRFIATRMRTRDLMIERQKEHKRMLELAAATNDALQLLMVDDAFARDFHRRLGDAIARQESEKKAGQSSGVRVDVSPQPHQAMEEESALIQSPQQGRATG